MGLIDSLKNVLGIKLVSIGELNKQANIKTPKPPPVRPVDPLEDVEITEEYRTIKELLEKNVPILFVSGKAGSGKSTLIHWLRKILNKKIVVVAPTGVASLNVQGSTIHSFFQLPPRVVTLDDIKKVQDRKLYTKLDLLIIDEISMVRPDHIDAIDGFLRLNGRDSQKPFGGTQLLFVGDLFQLPPVVTRAEEPALAHYDSPFFFSSRSLQNLQLIPVELTKIFRQKDSAFTDMLNLVRVAEDLNNVIPKINEACFKPDSSPGSLLTLTSTNHSADQLNESELNKLPGEAKTYTGEISGKFNIKDDKLPSPLNLRLKVGARVMFTKNDDQNHRRWVNGTMGEVKEITEKSIRVELLTDHQGAVYDVPKAKWETHKYEYDSEEDKIKPHVMGSYVQYPLMLAWAVTIHKGQGKTLEKVYIDLGSGAFAPGQVYVALSRCRSLADISLARPINIQEVKCDKRIKLFYQALKAC